MTTAHTVPPAAASPLAADEVRVVTIHDGDRDRTRARLRALLAAHLALPEDDVRLEIGPKGKPALANDPSLHFSVSHTVGVALLALTRVAEVGVDVERARSVPNAGAVVARFFPPDQVRAILTDDQRDLRFVEAWTRAEAGVKARGASVWEAATGDESTVVRAVRAPDGYAAAVACRAPVWRVTECTWPVDESA